ncbi:MAG TPA: ABC transporter substrate-binding protein [Candidatus Acidoferrales bacterium]|nr:ABC transporter substrate-binding protein [Candidatus Acidoferrales bacterium]
MLPARLSAIVMLLAIACGGATANPSPAAPLEPATINVGYSEPVADNLPLYIAQEAGFFSKRQLTANVQQVTSTQGIPALLSGQIDIDHLGGSEVMSAAAQGADLVMLGTLTPFSPYSLYAAPGLTTAADLKGKRAAITRPGASLDISLHIALQRIGLDPDKDVQYINTGSVPNVIAAMLSGQAQVTVSKPPESLQLDAKNFNVLLNLAKEKIPVANTSLVARRSWIATHRDVVQRYVDSIIEGIAREKKDRAYAIQVLSKYTKSTDQVALSAGYDLYSGIVQSLPYSKPEQLAAAQAQLGKNNDKVKNFDLTKLIDSSFIQDAAKRGLGK